MPDVSIIIPVHNRVELLRETLISCALQTFGDCEILIVDDGSEQDVPGVVEWVRTVFGGPCVLRYIRQTRCGAPAARNRGLREATGRFIQFLDSDDLLHPEKIEIQRKRLSDRPELDMVVGLDEFFHKIPGDMGVLWNTPGEPTLDRFLWDDGVWHTGSPLWKRSAVDRVGPWDEQLLCFQDWEYHIRALCRGIQYAHVPRVLQYIRDHPGARISSGLPLLNQGQGKLQAASAVASELRRCSLWSSRRGDALAVLFLQFALNLRQQGRLGMLTAALGTALRYAGSLRLRLAACSMLGVAVVGSIKIGGRRDSVATVYQFARRCGAIPTHRSNWKRSACPSAEIPSSLLRSLESSAEEIERIS